MDERERLARDRAEGVSAMRGILWFGAAAAVAYTVISLVSFVLWAVFR